MKVLTRYIIVALMAFCPIASAFGQKTVTLEGERAAAAFLLSIGVEMIEWPYNWKNPSLGTNRAILDDTKVKILKVDSVMLDDKKKLIVDSINPIR